MSAIVAAQVGAAASGAHAANRQTVMDNTRQPGQQGDLIPNPNQSRAGAVNEQVLNVVESQAFNYGVTAATGGVVIVQGGMASTALGGTFAAGATAAAGTFAVALTAGIVGGKLGTLAGDAIGHAIASSKGWKKVATEGENVARLDDDIAHQKKDLGLWGAIGGILLGAAVAVAIVATGGTALIVIAAAAAAAGFVGGAVAAIGNALGQYGENKGKIMQGSTNVFFNDRPVARVGDIIVCSDHPTPVPPVLAEGAKTVFANNKQIVRLGHRTTCDGNVNSASGNIIETKETALTHKIIDSRNPWLRWAVPITAVIAAVVSTKVLKKVAESNASKNNSAKNTETGSDPVDMVTGDYFQQWTAIAIPGVLPLKLSRLYRSGAEFNFSGSFGEKWLDDWSQYLELQADSIDYLNEEGVLLSYHTPKEAVLAINLKDKRYLLSGKRSACLTIFDRQSQQLLTFAQAQGNKRYLSAIEDRKGNRIDFHYYLGNLTEIHHSDGYKLLINSKNKRLHAILLVAKEIQLNLLRCEYNQQGYLTQCNSFQFGDLTHDYNPHGYMTQWKDTHATDVSINYNEQGQVVSLGATAGYFQDRFIYDCEHRKTTYLDAEGGKTEYHYNKDNLVTCVVDPSGHNTFTEWDLTTKIAQTDALGRTTRYQHNDYNQLTGIHFADGRKAQYSYDRFGQLATVENIYADKWRYIYDEQGRLRKQFLPNERWIEYRYNDYGDVLRKTSSDGQEWRYYYAEDHSLKTVQDSDGNRTQFDLDVLGRINAYTDACGNTTHYHHSEHHANPDGSMNKIILADGTIQLMDYNSERLVAGFTDGEGKTTRYEYGAFDLLLSQIRPDGSCLNYHYDKLTRLSAITNALGERYELIRDRSGRVIEEKDFTGRRQHYRYDAAGRLTARQTGQHTRSYHYSDTDLLLSVKHGEDEIRYCYDQRDRLIGVSNRDAEVEFSYNAADELIEERINGHRVSYKRDQNSGQIVQKHLASLHLNYHYGLTGRLEQLQVNQHSPLSLQHDALGREIRQESGSGFVLAQNYSRNGLLHSQAAGRRSAIFDEQRALTDPSRRLIGSELSRHYRYDKAFNVTGISEDRWGESHYQYNNNNQVVDAQFKGAQRKHHQFNYDANLNLIRQLSPQVDTQAKLQQQENGRVIRSGNTQYYYNEQGQQIEKRQYPPGFRPLIWKYRWNTQGQLIELLTPTQERWRYAYDGFGRRIRKFQVIAGDKSLPQPLTSLVDERQHSTENNSKLIGYDYFWSGDQLTEEIPLYADGTLAYNHAIHWLYKDDSHSPFARYEKGKLHYVVTDQIGSPRELFDEEGQLVWAAKQDTWGKTSLWKKITHKPMFLAANDDNKPTCQLRFPGQYEDKESGLHYNRFRYYDPDTAQYLSADPIGLEGGINPYGYVHNPLSWVDPLGLASCDLKGNNWEFNSQKDVDMRGTGKTYRDGLDEAFHRTGVPKEQFEVTKWGKDQYGKSIPVEWQGPNGANVNMDIPSWNNIKPNGTLGEGPHAPHIGYQTPGKPRTRGHIFVDEIPATRR